MGLPARVTAQSLYVVYKQLPAEVQTEFRHLLSQDASPNDLQGWFTIAETSLSEVWDTPENDVWDQFYAEHRPR